MKRVMKPIFQHPGGAKGVALVIVLAFVVLLTGLIVAFFSRAMNERGISNSSANQTKAELFAHGALDTIVGDLKQEIAAGSSATTIGTTTIYSPSAASATMPNRVGTSTNLPTLVKRSASAQPFFAGNAYNTGAHPASDRASTVSSTSASANGRVVTPARWNKPLLLPKKTPASDTDFAPLDSGPTPFVAPDWIYVARDGSNPGSNGTPAAFGSTGATVNNPSASNTRFVIGRYAYTIYDEGALLDMNVAGYPVDSPPVAIPQVTTTAQSGGKGVLAYADLTQLPGIATTAPPSGTAFSTARQSNIINAIVGWRNYASSAPSGTFPSYAWTPAQGTNYFNAVQSNKTGFVKTANSAMVNGQTDKMFLSRQALMKLLLQGIATNATERANLQSALQYMGTFSRAVNAPSWSPQADASALPNAAGDFYSAGTPPATGLDAGTTGTGDFAYKKNSETDGFANRNLANVRFPASVDGTSVKHYDDSGNPTTYVVKEGDPYLQRRFSLAKIDWLTHTGPASGLAQAVKDCFGLEWGDDAYGNPCWIYKHGSLPDQPVKTAGIGATKTPPNEILTLDEAAALGREPDFFELLKAAILSGSLGRDPGPDVTNYNNWFNAEGYGTWYNAGPYRGVGGTGFDKISALTDHQIMQIGANIIDQYNNDSYPTAIYIQGPYVDCPSVPEYGPLNVVYGNENLPYLNKIHYIFANSAGAGGNYDGFNAWIQPELWNPFQVPSASATGDRPTSFCLQASGAMQMNKFTGSATVYAMAPTQLQYDYGTGLAESMIYFKDTLPAGVSTFANPLIVSASHQDTSVATTPAINVGPAAGVFKSQSPYDVLYTQNSSGYTPFLAIHAGFMPVRILPYLGQTLKKDADGNVIGGVDYGTAGDSTHTWVADSNVTYYGGAFHSDGNYIPSVTPIGPAIDKNVRVGGQGLTLCLKYWDGSNWLPYSYMSRILMGSGCTLYPSNSWVLPALAPAPNDPVFGASGGGIVGGINAPPFMHVDPLTDRFSGNGTNGSHGHWNTKNTTWQATGLPRSGQLAGNSNGIGKFNAPQPCPGAFYYDYHSYVGERSTNGVPAKKSGNPLDWADGGGGIGLFYGGWAQNIPVAGWVNDAYYADPDGIVRPGNDACWNVDNASSYTASMTDGLSQLPYGYSSTGIGTGPGGNAQTMGRRPLVLNRPFRSVGELGYAGRDLPFKTLDFFTAYSGDAALLDVFCVADQPPIVAGQINPNNAPGPVLQAVLAGATKQEALANSTTPHNVAAEAKGMASAISAFTAAAPGSFANRADLVTKLGVQFDKGAVKKNATSSVILNGFSASSNPKADQRNKAFLEAPVRALADVTNTRTWNLMIDVVAQTGKIAASATDLDKGFIVEGERRYWLHVAIDRFTGKVIDQQLEPVYE